ncbi:hypothetical protein JXB02_03325 [Candidatus Woesearchaeota archaeon]|nr:hypothetical protein [Candidatus Woesearchaeota archaeon]
MADPRLIAWIQGREAQGATPGEIYGFLVQQGYPPQVATQAVREAGFVPPSSEVVVRAGPRQARQSPILLWAFIAMVVIAGVLAALLLHPFDMEEIEEHGEQARAAEPAGQPGTPPVQPEPSPAGTPPVVPDPSARVRDCGATAMMRIEDPDFDALTDVALTCLGAAYLDGCAEARATVEDASFGPAILHLEPTEDGACTVSMRYGSAADIPLAVHQELARLSVTCTLTDVFYTFHRSDPPGTVGFSLYEEAYRGWATDPDYATRRCEGPLVDRMSA